MTKRDLQAAVKYGAKERTGRGWKYTFADVVYITDITSTVEITSWAVQLPLEKIPIDDSEQKQNDV